MAQLTPASQVLCRKYNAPTHRAMAPNPRMKIANAARSSRTAYSWKRREYHQEQPHPFPKFVFSAHLWLDSLFPRTRSFNARNLAAKSPVAVTCPIRQVRRRKTYGTGALKQPLNDCSSTCGDACTGCNLLNLGRLVNRVNSVCALRFPLYRCLWKTCPLVQGTGLKNDPKWNCAGPLSRAVGAAFTSPICRT